MKKSLFVLGVAVAALASCTQSEVLEVAEGRAIQFNTFVNNNTKAVSEINAEDGLSSFYVFGYHGSDVENLTNGVYVNESNSKIAYWVLSQTYRFAAYADGNGNENFNGNASFDAGTRTLSISGYTPDDTKDLVAAVPTTDITTDASLSNVGAVELSFKHLLSQVAFEFTTDAADSYTLTISKVQINGAVNTANCTYDGTNPVWEGSAVSGAAYSYSDLNNVDIADQEINYTASQSKLVIPQNNTNLLTVTFTATLAGDAVKDGTQTRNFTGYLSYSGTTPSTANTWTNGYRYKYTAKIDPDDIDNSLTDDKLIEFTATVTDWVNTNPEDTGLALQ